MTRSIDAVWGEDEVIFLPNASNNYLAITHNGFKKRIYYDENKAVGPLFLNVLEDIKSILLDGTIVFELEGDIITFTITNGEYHSINDKPSFSWTKNEKTIEKWHNHGKIIQHTVN